MRVSFISLDEENNKVSFQSEVIKIDNVYKFKDESTTNTYIELEEIGSCFRLTRTGDINMYMLFDLNNITSGSYENKEGLEFNFEIKTSKIEVIKNKIRIDYSMIMDKQVLSSHKLSLLFN
jgi:uncharacterized beta-barrel protein YwiB (DUF1934 family)